MLKMLLVSLPQPSALLWQQLCHPAGICLHCWVNSSLPTDRRASLLAEVCQGSTGQQEFPLNPMQTPRSGAVAPWDLPVPSLPNGSVSTAVNCIGRDPFVPVEHTGKAWYRTTPPKHGKIPPVFLISLFRASLLAIWLSTAGEATCIYNSRDKQSTYQIHASSRNTKSNDIPQEQAEESATDKLTKRPDITEETS